MNYNTFYVTSPGKGYTKFSTTTHYNDPIDDSDGRPAGNSRKWGDASTNVQKQVIDAIISEAQSRGLSTRDQAALLAIARTESGFNPDAAAGTTSASGIGQFIDKTGGAYGIDDSNRFDITNNVNALIDHYIDNKELAAANGHPDEIDWIYKYHHDGPTKDYGGLEIARCKILPLINMYEHELVGINYGDIYGGIDIDVTKIPGYFTSAQKALAPVRRDPLVLDLDGDGIETIAASATNPVLFDHDGDGLKKGTGWIQPDDGFLVMDRNGNGTIDSGRELFGDSTPLYGGGTASDGFEALAQEDTNADGVVNALDARWSNLKIWRDLNSDGISQSNELFTMEQAGVVELNISSIAHSQVLANGNQIADLGTYLKTDGSFGTLGEVSDMADVNLTIDTFHREFPDAIPVSEEVAALPDLQGSGLVRDLQEAAELSPVLQYLLTQYSQASTRQEQMAIIDQLLYAWADTSGMAATMESVKDEYLQKAA